MLKTYIVTVEEHRIQEDMLIREELEEDKGESYIEEVHIESASQKRAIKVCYFL